MTEIEIPAEETAVIWHDVECGAYAADLPLWEELAGAASFGRSGGSDVLDLGAGTGRVALHLARRGHRVCAIDNEPLLVGALRERAAASAIEVEALVADARRFAIGRQFDLVIAPMQLAHLLGGEERRSMLAAIAAHLAPGGIAAIAVMAELPEPWRAGRGSVAPAPDVRERDDWVFSSLPLAIEAAEDGILVRRLRHTVSPEGDLGEDEHRFRLYDLPAEQLEAEAGAAGLRPRERRQVGETEDHVGSTVVVLASAP